MKKLLLIIPILSCLFSCAQTGFLKPNNSLGIRYNRYRSDSGQGFPEDTFAIRGDQRNYHWMAWHGDTAYYWNVHLGIYLPFSSGGGSTIWGNIPGNINNQTDLATALAGKQAVLPPGGTTADYLAGNYTLRSLNTDVHSITDPLYSQLGHTHTASQITDFTSVGRHLWNQGTGITLDYTNGIISATGGGGGADSATFVTHYFLNNYGFNFSNSIGTRDHTSISDFQSFSRSLFSALAPIQYNQALAQYSIDTVSLLGVKSKWSINKGLDSVHALNTYTNGYGLSLSSNTFSADTLKLSSRTRLSWTRDSLLAVSVLKDSIGQYGFYSVAPLHFKKGGNNHVDTLAIDPIYVNLYVKDSNQLSGDGGVLNPLYIANSGVTAGTYSNPTISILADGRISLASQGSGSVGPYLFLPTQNTAVPAPVSAGINLYDSAGFSWKRSDNIVKTLSWNNATANRRMIFQDRSDTLAVLGSQTFWGPQSISSSTLPQFSLINGAGSSTFSQATSGTLTVATSNSNIVLPNTTVVNLTYSGGFTLLGTATNGNLWMPAGQTSSTTTNASYLFGNGTVNLRVGFRGQTSPTLGANTSYGAVVIGSMPVTTAATGNHAVLSSLVVLPPTYTNSGASIGKMATAMFYGPPNGYAIYDSIGLHYLGGNTEINGTLNVNSISDAAGNFLTVSSNQVKSRTAAETLSDIGALSGSGSALTVPEYTGANTLGGSNIFHYTTGGVSHYGINAGTPSGATFIVESTENIDFLQTTRTGTVKFKVSKDGDASLQHLLGIGSTPSVAVGVNIAGGASISVIGNDVGGTVTMTTTSPSSLATSDALFTLTFAAAYGSTPSVVFSPANSAAIGNVPGTFVKNAGTTSFQLATSPSLTLPATTYIWTYKVSN